MLVGFSGKDRQVLPLSVPSPFKQGRSSSASFFLQAIDAWCGAHAEHRFQYLMLGVHPPNSARFSYATEGALFISAQLSSDAVSALRKVRVLI